VLYDRLRRIQPSDLNDRQWCIAGKVSTSFFTDVRNGTIPSIDKVERMVNVAGMTLTDFVSDGELRRGFSVDQLRSAFQDALPLPVGSLERQASFLADVVLDILGLPPSLQPNLPTDENAVVDVPAAGALPLPTTKQT
jgi:hypothetical protein